MCPPLSRFPPLSLLRCGGGELGWLGWLERDELPLSCALLSREPPLSRELPLSRDGLRSREPLFPLSREPRSREPLDPLSFDPLSSRG